MVGQAHFGQRAGRLEPMALIQTQAAPSEEQHLPHLKYKYVSTEKFEEWFKLGP